MGLRLREICLDCPDPEASAEFWAAALGYRVTDRDEEGVELTGAPGVPTILLLRSDDVKSAKTPIHLDLSSVGTTRDEEVARLESLGARRVDIGQGDDVSWVVLADPAGLEFCVLSGVHPPEPEPFEL
ncbi:lactoylglutathione lyase [Paraoerskovia sediminicola]|uniref:Lactoylglutathione lyase n=1 Tax=Paraoerskovia sediminicola TaxID=1138587 RepID=A0ABM8G061_9CELL|nr:VOC family protein [Paraoerskovia sediminicola]BDZ41478.1 lactoylglutathione lyase [Paraoerskovia sediminicola]